MQVFIVTPEYRGDKFFVKEEDVWKVTPLFVVLAVIELSDVIFAIDSIPAVFGVTLDPLVVYTSNMAAILSLRSLYVFVATVIAELRCFPKVPFAGAIRVSRHMQLTQNAICTLLISFLVLLTY
jgi:predicted tellurium resistance membrane protein TerC